MFFYLSEHFYDLSETSRVLSETFCFLSETFHGLSETSRVISETFKKNQRMFGHPPKEVKTFDIHFYVKKS